MKVTKLLALSTLLLGVAVADAQSQQTIIPVNITARIVSQSTNTTDRHGVTSTPAPRVRTFSNGDILRRLAADQGTTYPRGSRLAVVDGSFSIVQGTNIIADVSTIIRLDFGSNEVFYGRQDDTNGLASPSFTRINIGRLVFDDTSINSTNGLSFYMQGVLTVTTVDSVVSRRNNTYVETNIATMPNASGEGTNNIGSGADQTVIVSGSLSANGTSRQTLIPVP